MLDARIRQWHGVMRNARIERVRVRKLESALQGSEEALEALEGLELNLDGLEPHLDGLDQTLQQETQGRGTPRWHACRSD